MAAVDDFSDDDLGLYVDGEAELELVTSIEKALRNNPELAQRIANLRATTQNFRSVYTQLLDQAPETPPFLQENETRGRPVLLALASMVAGAAIMFGGLHFQQTNENPGWKAVVANYQSLYVTETLTSNAVDPAQRTQVLSRLTDKLGFDFDALPDVDGLTFIRAQELGFNGKPLAQLTFLNSQNEPVALCIIKTIQSPDDTISPEEMFGLATYSWNQGGFGILLLGPNENKDLMRAAERFQKAFAHINA